ncbi:MAG: SpoIID/LytB domain-containing protein [Patescibacteria group bacterium]|nr:SpoIID/LytB domain-containing protein [Patescibacteria group bacterium]MDD5715653.1 SpoIID/LytB domain-containing protein [Patescibacteria group bacterium]
MQKNGYTVLFTVVMVLLLLPFIPEFIGGQQAKADTIDDYSPFTEAFDPASAASASDAFSEGCVGTYGPRSVPAVAEAPRVLGATVVKAAAEEPPAYQAQLTGKSNGLITLNPGQALTVWVDFLNTGTATWYRNGDHFIALNVAGPAGRESPFQHKFWNEYYYRPTRLLQDEVKPGEIGRFRFALQAPEQVATYFEEFSLVAENLLWIPGGSVHFTIGVGQSAKGVPYYRAAVAGKSKGGTITADPGVSFTFWVDFKNTGSKTWYNAGDHFIALNVADPIGRVSEFKHDYWNEYYYRPARLMQQRVLPGETGRFQFALKAPTVEAYYTEKFALVAENLLWIPGGNVTLKFKIGDPPQQTPVEPITGEPTVRIGLYTTTETVTVTANGAYSVVTPADGKQTAKKADVITNIAVNESTYTRIVPDDPNTIVEITSYQHSPGWNSTLNDNTFRGNVEVRHSANTGETWVINELPVESYLRGLAEVVNEQPPEYLKSLIVAARSYVLWHTVRGGKHADNYYDINANTDQVYRGYGFEQRSIDPLAAVIATSGVVITHPDAVTTINPQGIAIAAYSSGTDGRTRSWNEVWAGSGYPWLVSVDDPYGKISNWNTLEGNHMVGLSAQGARGYATEEGKSFDWILQHYYSGTSVEKIY